MSEKESKEKTSITKKELMGIITACMVLVISLCLPANACLTVTGIRTVGVLIAFLVMLVTEALPVVVVKEDSPYDAESIWKRYQKCTACGHDRMRSVFFDRV